jgi:hypothetical protein
MIFVTHPTPGESALHVHRTLGRDLTRKYCRDLTKLADRLEAEVNAGTADRTDPFVQWILANPLHLMWLSMYLYTLKEGLINPGQTLAMPDWYDFTQGQRDLTAYHLQQVTSAPSSNVVSLADWRAARSPAPVKNEGAVSSTVLSLKSIVDPFKAAAERNAKNRKRVEQERKSHNQTVKRSNKLRPDDPNNKR